MCFRIMIASINQVDKTIKLISIPRDTYVSVAGHGKTKINHAYAYGKEQLALKTINSNFGLNISEYVTINFKGLIMIKLFNTFVWKIVANMLY